MSILGTHPPDAAAATHTTHATNLAVVEEATASPEVRALYAQFREHFGQPRVPGILKCFATHPPLLQHMMGLADSLLFSDGALGRCNKELIATFLSARNTCAYCTDSHGAFLLNHGGSADMLRAATSRDLSSTALDPAQQALLQFVSRINDEAGHLEPHEIVALRDVGWDDLQIAEAIHLAALFACFNRVVSAFGLPSQNLLAALETYVQSEAGTQ